VHTCVVKKLLWPFGSRILPCNSSSRKPCSTHAVAQCQQYDLTPARVLGHRSPFFHVTALTPTSSTSTWGSRSNGTHRQCTTHWFTCSGHPETLSLPCARQFSTLLQRGDEETGREALRLVPPPWARVHLLLPMPGINHGASISGADPRRWPRPRRETAGPGGRIVPAPRHADGPRPSARSESDDAPARPRCGGGCRCCPA